MQECYQMPFVAQNGVGTDVPLPNPSHQQDLQNVVYFFFFFLWVYFKLHSGSHEVVMNLGNKAFSCIAHLRIKVEGFRNVFGS